MKPTPPPLPALGALKISKPNSCSSLILALSLTFSQVSVTHNKAMLFSWMSSVTKAILLHKDRALKRPILREYINILELLGVSTFIEEPILALDLSKNLLL